jgi:hypothetical protein
MIKITITTKATHPMTIPAMAPAERPHLVTGIKVTAIIVVQQLCCICTATMTVTTAVVNI